MPEIHLDDGRRVPYSIRISPRSRRVRLTLNPRDGLVMVSPPGVDNAELAALATSWRDWIARHQPERGDVADVQLDDALALLLHLPRLVEHGPPDVVSDVGELAGLGNGLQDGAPLRHERQCCTAKPRI